MTGRRFFLFVLALAAFQTAAFPGQWFGAEGDEALYALLARGVNRGHYGLGIFPGDPLYGEVTPGWPVLLAPAALLSGDSPLGYQAWSFLWLAACDLLAFLWFRRRMGARQAAALTALFALNPLVLSRAGVVMPELPGLAVALLALLLADRRGPAPAPAVGAVLAAAYLIRPALLPLALAVPAAYWVRGLRRDAAVSGAVVGGCWAAWRLWTRWAGGFSDLGEGLRALSGPGFTALPGAAFHNIAQALALWGGTMTPTGGLRAVSFLLGAAAGALAAYALARRFRKGPDAASLFLAGAVLLHLCWPWWYERYLPPLLPFLILGAWQGALRLGLPRRWAFRAAVVLTLLPLPWQAAAVVRRAAVQEPPCADAYAFLKSLPQDRLAASVYFARDSWYSGRPVLPLPPPQAPLSGLRLGWVFWTDPGDLGSSLGGAFPAQRSLKAWEALLASPAFRPVFRGRDGSVVYEAVEGTKVTRPPS
ncbi:MAG: hypothetical protein HY928_15055 [Elusimicrobia bacterium]|nr:hypothetical protein [Elusimicrobiota bacterium]